MKPKLVALAAVWPAMLSAQAPAAVGLWDIAGTTLASPPALETGPTGAIWNPSAVLERPGLRAGVQSIQTPDVLGLAGFVFGMSQSLGSRLGLGLVYGRVHVTDLVRTTTSPVSQAGEIPVYEQFLGLSLGAQAGPLQVAVLVRGHDARFDIFRESGFTIDAGVAAEPLPNFRLAGSTQFVPADFSTGRVERYFGAVEYSPFTVAALGTTRVVARYGAALRDRRHLEHQVGIGTEFGSVIGVDAGVVRERTSTSASWRAIVAISVRAGRYRILAARGGGLADVGANYRVGLDVDLVR